LMTLVIAVASLGLTAISLAGVAVGWIYFCLVAAATARTFLWPASSAFLPSLVSRSNFSKAVTWNTGSFQLSSVLGPAAGGAVIALRHRSGSLPDVNAAAALVYVLNTVASLVCLTLISFVRRRHVVAVKEKMTLRSLIVGFEFVFRSRVILGTITLDLFAVLLGGATVLLPIYAKDILQVGPSGLGWLRAALPAGSLVCALVLAHRPPLQRAGRTLLWAVTFFGLATIGFGLVRSFWVSFAMLFLCGVTDNV